MARHLRVVLFLAVLMIIFQANASANEMTQRNVRLDYDGQTIHILTTAKTIGEALEDYGIVIDEKDIVSPSIDRMVVENDVNRVRITSGFNITVVLDKTERFELKIRPDERAGHILAEVNELYDTEYHYVDGFMNDSFSEGDVVEFVSVTVREFEIVEKIPYEQEIIYNDELDEGIENIIQDGEYGEFVYVTAVEYIGDEEISRAVISEEVIREPVNQIIEIGTKVEEPVLVVETSQGFFEYEAVLVMEATAYSAMQPELSNYTATGKRAVRGVVAVDPNKIPLGTELYIEGYGRAIAADTGGAIKGNKIDLCYDTVQECIIFGRRMVTVYILK